MYDRLDLLPGEPLTKDQFNQLLLFGHQAGVSNEFFPYYWLECPPRHPYPVELLHHFEADWLDGSKRIVSLAHLKWGLYRIFVDGLLYFGNIRTVFRALRSLNRKRLDAFFATKRFNTEALKARSEVLPMASISQNERYMVSEMACKSFGDNPDSEGGMRQALKDVYEQHVTNGGGPVTFRQLLAGDLPEGVRNRQFEFQFALDDALEHRILSPNDFDETFGAEADKFFRARRAALAGCGKRVL